MLRRDFLRLLSYSMACSAGGCALARIDPMHVLIRSDVIENSAQEKEILSRARVNYWIGTGFTPAVI